MRRLIFQIRKPRMAAMHLVMASRAPETDTCLPHFLEAMPLDRFTFSPSLALKGEKFLTPCTADAILVCFVLLALLGSWLDPMVAAARERRYFSGIHNVAFREGTEATGSGPF